MATGTNTGHQERIPRLGSPRGAAFGPASGPPDADPAVTTVSPWCAMAVMVVERPVRTVSVGVRSGGGPGATTPSVPVGTGGRMWTLGYHPGDGDTWSTSRDPV